MKTLTLQTFLNRWLKCNILSVMYLTSLNVSFLPCSLPINVKATMRATTLFPFIFQQKNWVSSSRLFQHQWLHALLVVCLVRHFQIFWRGFLVNNNKWSRWLICWERVFFRFSDISKKSHTTLDTFTVHATLFWVIASCQHRRQLHLHIWLMM